jgi:hypothetical protein
LKKVTRTSTTNTPKERKIPTGYTPSNFVNQLSGWSALMANTLSVDFPTNVSPKVRNNPSKIIALQLAEKRISAHIFLFSILLILAKKAQKEITTAINIPTLCKLKLLRRKIPIPSLHDLGNKVECSKTNIL